MCIEPYLIGAAVNAVLAQRLVRRICSKCKQPYQPARAMQAAAARIGVEISEFYHGVGCKRCRNTGYSGRIGIHELLVIDDTLRDMISARKQLSELRAYARSRGVPSLAYDGLTKVKEGITTIEEVLKVCEHV
jgi:type IV pilus assembly protein PilB